MRKILICVAIACVLISIKTITHRDYAPDKTALVTYAKTFVPNDRPPLAGGTWRIQTIDKVQTYVAYMKGSHREFAIFVNVIDGGKFVRTGGADFRGSQNYFALGSPRFTHVAIWLLLMSLVGGFCLWRVKGVMRQLDCFLAMSLPLCLTAFQYNKLDWAMAIGPVVLFYLGARCLYQLYKPQPINIRSLDYVQKIEDRLIKNRWLFLAAVVVAGFVALVTLFNNQLIDVAQCSMAGATLLLEGKSPYGNIPFVFHGDTYPILAYIAYIPAALVQPVDEGLDDYYMASYLMYACWIALGAATYFAARRLRIVAPLISTIVLMLSPSLLLIISSGNNDVLLALLLMLSLSGSMWAMSLGVWAKLLTLPLLLTQLRRDNWKPFAGLSVICLSIVAITGGFANFETMLHAVGYQVTRGSSWDPAFLFGPVVGFVFQAAGLSLVFAGMAYGFSTNAQQQSHRWLLVCLTCLLGLQAMSSFWNPFYVGWLSPLLGLWLLSDRSSDESESSQQLADGQVS